MPVKKSRGSGRAPRKMSVWDPVQKQAYPIGSEDAMLAGFSRCTQKRVPSYESGACLEPNGPRAQELGIYLDTKGKRAPDSYVWVNDSIGWVAECSDRAAEYGFNCCAGANRFPSPQSGRCIEVGGPTYEELGMMKRRINGADYFSTRDNFDMAPAPSMADGPFWPANTYVVSDADAANFGSERRLRISNANMQRAMNQQSQAPRMSRKFFLPTGPKPIDRRLKPGWVPTGPVSVYENDPYMPMRDPRDVNTAAMPTGPKPAPAVLRNLKPDWVPTGPVSVYENDPYMPMRDPRDGAQALFDQLAAQEAAAKERELGNLAF